QPGAVRAEFKIDHRGTMAAQEGNGLAAGSIQHGDFVLVPHGSQAFAVSRDGGYARRSEPVLVHLSGKDTRERRRPQADRLIRGGGRDLSARRSESDSLNGFGMSFFKVGQLAAGGGFPEAERLVGTDARQQLAARRKGNRRDGLAVALHAVLFF